VRRHATRAFIAESLGRLGIGEPTEEHWRRNDAPTGKRTIVPVRLVDRVEHGAQSQDCLILRMLKDGCRQLLRAEYQGLPAQGGDRRAIGAPQRRRRDLAANGRLHDAKTIHGLQGERSFACETGYPGNAEAAVYALFVEASIQIHAKARCAKTLQSLHFRRRLRQNRPLLGFA
jgi:hypothetical protein